MGNLFEQCPGAKDVRQPRPELIKCSKCGKETEIWTDEIKVKCEHCGAIVFRKEKASCLDWCSFAKECVGEEALKKYQEEKKQGKT